MEGHLLVVGEEVEQVEAEDGVLALRLADDAVKLIIIVLEHTDVALEFFNFLLLDRKEGGELVDLT